MKHPETDKYMQSGSKVSSRKQKYQIGNVKKFSLDSIDSLGDMALILGLRFFMTFCDVI